jgi:protease I
MLCADGAGRGHLREAIFAYNHACWYVRDVLAIAARYRTPGRHRQASGPRHRHRTRHKVRHPVRRKVRHKVRHPVRRKVRHRARRRAGLCTGHRHSRGYGHNMALAQRKVLILAADDFEDMELLYPLYRLVEEDVEVTVAGLDDHPVHGKKGHGPVPVDTTVEQVTEGDFDALVIPGGYAPDKLRRSEDVLGLVRAFDGAGKPIAFICHAGWVPISARILAGRRATSVGAIRDDMVNAGTDWVDEATVVDGNLISARTPADLGPWMKALLKALAIG